MEMMMFDCQDENDRFMNSVAQNRSSYSKFLVVNYFVGIFINAFSNNVADKSANTFINYETGEKINTKVSLTWLPGNPDFWAGAEWCAAIESFDQGSSGLNDYNCNDYITRFYGACQETSTLSKPKGFKNP